MQQWLLNVASKRLNSIPGSYSILQPCPAANHMGTVTVWHRFPGLWHLANRPSRFYHVLTSLKDTAQNILWNPDDVSKSAIIKYKKSCAICIDNFVDPLAVGIWINTQQFNVTLVLRPVWPLDTSVWLIGVLKEYSGLLLVCTIHVGSAPPISPEPLSVVTDRLLCMHAYIVACNSPPWGVGGERPLHKSSWLMQLEMPRRNYREYRHKFFCIHLTRSF